MKVMIMISDCMMMDLPRPVNIALTDQIHHEQNSPTSSYYCFCLHNILSDTREHNMRLPEYSILAFQARDARLQT